MHISQGLAAPLRRVLPVVVLSLFGARIGVAQVTHIGMVHGLKSDGSTWAAAESRLYATYGTRIQVTRPSLPWGDSYLSQSGVLLSLTPQFPNSAILIGHSNGGLVSRTSVLSRGAQGIITVGSPHRGAGLMSNFGSAAAWFTNATFAIRDPIQMYSSWDNNTGTWMDASIAGYLADLAINTGAGFIANWLLGTTWQLASDMAPGTGWGAATLNSTANLAAEATAMGTRRVGIATVVPPYGIMCSLFGWSQAYCRNTWDAAGNAFAGLWVHYALLPPDQYDPWWWAKVSNAWRWQLGANYLWNVDYRYCEFMGAVPNGTGCDSDGVVPLSSQLYPGGIVEIIADGTSHLAQTNHPEVHTRMVNQLIQRFNIP